MIKRKKNIKRNQWLQLILVLVIIVFANLIGNSLFTRFDLTSEKRYTLSDATKEILTNLDDIVYFKIYLEGEFPAGFKRLRRETKELLACSKNRVFLHALRKTVSILIAFWHCRQQAVY